jgi:hypothetical protein
MSGKKEFKERRVHKRFHIKNGAFAAIKEDSLKLGLIKNISKVGLAFTCIDDRYKLPSRFVLTSLLAAKNCI